MVTEKLNIKKFIQFEQLVFPIVYIEGVRSKIYKMMLSLPNSFWVLSGKEWIDYWSLRPEIFSKLLYLLWFRRWRIYIIKILQLHWRILLRFTITWWIFLFSFAFKVFLLLYFYYYSFQSRFCRHVFSKSTAPIDLKFSGLVDRHRALCGEDSYNRRVSYAAATDVLVKKL